MNQLFDAAVDAVLHLNIVHITSGSYQRIVGIICLVSGFLGSIGVYLMDVFLMGVYLTGLHLMGVYLIDVYRYLGYRWEPKLDVEDFEKEVHFAF